MNDKIHEERMMIENQMDKINEIEE